MAVDWFLGAHEDDGVCGAELVGDLDGEHQDSSFALAGGASAGGVLPGWVLFQVLSERKAMMAMMTLATTPAAECAKTLKAIQQKEARAA